MIAGRWLAAAVLTITTIASCTGTTGTALPPRPALIAADRIPPCSMLTPAQEVVLGLRARTPGQGTVDGQPSPGCSWLGTAIGFNVQFIPIGAEVATTVPDSTVIQVNGFGAVRNMAEVPGSPPICQVTIDVAPGQSVRVQASAVPDAPYGTDELCRRATEAASMVMTTVVATASR